MGELHVHEFITADGVYEDPSFTMPYGFDPEMGKAIGAFTAPADTILLGRNTYEMFAPAWSTRTAEDDEGAPFFNDTSKLVVASQPLQEQWQNTEVFGAYDADAIRKLKAESNGIYISGSGQLVRALLADGLVDGLHLFVYPVVLGSGARLWDGISGQVDLELATNETYDNGVVHLSYRSKR